MLGDCYSSSRGDRVVVIVVVTIIVVVILVGTESVWVEMSVGGVEDPRVVGGKQITRPGTRRPTGERLSSMT